MSSLAISVRWLLLRVVGILAEQRCVIWQFGQDYLCPVRYRSCKGIAGHIFNHSFFSQSRLEPPGEPVISNQACDSLRMFFGQDVLGTLGLSHEDLSKVGG